MSTSEPESEDLRSRSDEKRARRELEDALARLAKDLVESRRVAALGLDEELSELVESARNMSSAPAKNRQLRLVRSALREQNWSLIRARLDAVTKHGALPSSLGVREDSAAARAPEWTARLLGEGTAALDALAELAPTLDREHLRDLVRQVHKASAGRRKKAEERLSAAIRTLLR